MTLSQQKQELRRLFRRKRSALPSKDYQTFSASTCYLLQQVLKPFQAQTIAGYWPIYHEVNIQPLLMEWYENNWTVCLPALNPHPQPESLLLFREWSPKTTCHSNRFNIPEPPADAVIHKPSVLCIPCLAFDRQGYRLGYGKGYYDNYLDSINDHQTVCFKIGIAFSFQEHTDIPHEPHDHPMNLIVTEKEIIEPMQSPSII